MRKRCPAIAVVWIAASSAAWAAPLTIEQAVEVALEKNPSVQETAEKVHEGQANTSEAFSAGFPTIGAGLSAQMRRDPLNIGNPLFDGENYNLYNFQFNLDQPLYRGGSFWAGLAFARKEEQLREIDLGIARRDLTVNVLRSYYQVLLERQKLEAFERQVDVQDDLLKLTRHRLKIGRNQPIDELQIQQQLALLGPQIDEARNSTEVAAASLATLLGDRDAKEIEISGALPPLDLKPVIAAAKTKGFNLLEIERINLVQEQFQDRRTVTMAKNYPTFDAIASWGRAAYVKTDLLNDYSTQWVLGLQLNVPIFSGLSSRADRRVLASQEVQIDRDSTNTKDQLALNQVTSMKALDTAERKIVSLKKAYDLSQALLKQARHDYSLSTIDLTQFLAIQAASFQAEIDYDQAKYDSIVATASYFAYSGLPMEDLVKALGKQAAAQ